MIKITNKKQRGNEMKTYQVNYTIQDGTGESRVIEDSARLRGESYRTFLDLVIELAENGCVFQSASITWDEYDSEIVKRGESIDITYKVQADVVKFKKARLYSESDCDCDCK